MLTKPTQKSKIDFQWDKFRLGIIVLFLTSLIVGCKDSDVQNQNNKYKTISIKENIIGRWFPETNNDDSTFKYAEFSDSNYYSVRFDETLVDKYKIDGNNIIVLRSYWFNGMYNEKKIVFEYLDDSTLARKSDSTKKYHKQRKGTP